MPKVKKLPKWAIRRAGGINKKAWALARRGKGRKMAKAKPRKTPRRRSILRAVGGASHNNSKPGWGKWFRMGRTADIFTGPIQGSLARRGLTKEAAVESANLYLGGTGTDEIKPGSRMQSLQDTAGGIGTGLIRDWFRSKLGIYRGLGRKKILSGVMAANPEIMASAELGTPGLEGGPSVQQWNTFRTQYDRAYDANQHNWDVAPQSGPGSRFLQSLGLDLGLKGFQKLAEHFINPNLLPGYNL